MKNFGIIGSFLMGMITIAQLFEKTEDLNTKKILMLLILGLAYGSLSHEIKFEESKLFKEYSIAHGLIFILFVINTFWYPILEENKLLSISILAYNLFLIKEPSGLNVCGFIIALYVYLQEGYNLINEKEKPFINILKIIACGALIIYYGSEIFGESHAHKPHKSHKPDITHKKKN